MSRDRFLDGHRAWSDLSPTDRDAAHDEWLAEQPAVETEPPAVPALTCYCSRPLDECRCETEDTDRERIERDRDTDWRIRL